MKSMILAVFRVVKGQLVKLVHMHNVLVASANLFWRISIWAHITIWVGHRRAHFVQSFHKCVSLKLCIESRRIWLGQVLGLPCPTLSSVCNIYICIYKYLCMCINFCPFKYIRMMHSMNLMMDSMNLKDMVPSSIHISTPLSIQGICGVFHA